MLKVETHFTYVHTCCATVVGGLTMHHDSTRNHDSASSSVAMVTRGGSPAVDQHSVHPSNVAEREGEARAGH